MIRIKSDHKLRGFAKYLAVDSHESPPGGRGKLIDTWTYDVPVELTEKAIALGGELLETTTDEREEIPIEDRVCIEMTWADNEALRGRLHRLLDLSDNGGRQPAPVRFTFNEIHTLTEEIRGILGMETSE